MRQSSAEALAQALGAGELCEPSTAPLAGLINLSLACHCSPGAKAGISLDRDEVPCINCACGLLFHLDWIPWKGLDT